MKIIQRICNLYELRLKCNYKYLLLSSFESIPKQATIENMS